MVYPNPSGCYKTIYQVIFEDPSKKVPCIEMSVLCVRNIEIIGCVFFPSSKFSQKIRYVFNLAELAELVPMEYVGIPECIRQYVPALFYLFLSLCRRREFLPLCILGQKPCPHLPYTSTFLHYQR